MRLTAPAMAADAARRAWSPRARRVLDAGMVATEMLYHLVGSRELDGGAMVTASHNPKAYTGVKLVREGALPLSGDAGIGDVRREIEAGLGAAPGGGSARGGRRLGRSSARHALSFIDPDNGEADEGGRRRRQRHGRADGRADPRAAAARAGGDVLRARRRVPRPRAEPAAGGEPAVHHRPGAAPSGADLGIAWDGDADRCFFIDDAGEFCDGDFICALLARAVLAQEPGRDDPLRPALEPRRARPGRRRGRALGPLAGRPRLLQGADARGGRGLRRRGLRPLLLPATSGTPTRARSRRC